MRVGRMSKRRITNALDEHNLQPGATNITFQCSSQNGPAWCKTNNRHMRVRAASTTAAKAQAGEYASRAAHEENESHCGHSYLYQNDTQTRARKWQHRRKRNCRHMALPKTRRRVFRRGMLHYRSETYLGTSMSRYSLAAHTPFNCSSTRATPSLSLLAVTSSAQAFVSGSAFSIATPQPDQDKSS